MGYLDNYNQRVISDGESVGESLKNNTEYFIQNKFKDSPTYRLAGVQKNNLPITERIDIRVLEVNRMGSIRNILLRPQEDLDIGCILEFDDELWLSFDKFGSKYENTKLTVSKINERLKWYDADGYLHTLPCVATTSYLGSKSRQSGNSVEYNTYDVKLPTGQVFVFVELNDETKKIELNHRFVFGKNVYEVNGMDDMTLVDKNYYGVIQYTMKLVTLQENDDLNNKIAYNNYRNEETVLVDPPIINGGDSAWGWQ